jgi:hypothetical protein
MTEIDDSGHVVPEITAAQLDQLIADLRAQRTKVDEMKALMTPENIKLQKIEGQIAAALKSLGRDNYFDPRRHVLFYPLLAI